MREKHKPGEDSHRSKYISLMRRQGLSVVPVEFVLCPALIDEYEKRYGNDTPFEDRFQFSCKNIADLMLPPKQEIDWSRYYDVELKPGVTFDIWGVAHEPGSSKARHMTYMRHPMQRFDSLDQFQAYPYPDYLSASSDHMADEVKEAHKNDLVAMGWMQMSIWEAAWFLRGMEELLMDMMDESPLAVFLLDQITDFAVARASAFAKAGCDAIFLGDDIGMQQTTMMSPKMYQTWLKPRLKKVIQKAKAIKPDLLVIYHSCGYVTPFINDLIEIGVDVLNPVQPECMDFAEIHAEFGDRLSFHGTLGTQALMPFGSPEEVKQTVWKHLDIAGDKGGLLVCPTHILEPETPWDNIEAYMDACKGYLGR